MLTGVLTGILAGVATPPEAKPLQVIDTTPENSFSDIVPYIVISVAGIGAIIGTIFLLRKK